LLPDGVIYQRGLAEPGDGERGRLAVVAEQNPTVSMLPGSILDIRPFVGGTMAR
jgi:hypothetical protein